MRRSPRLPIAVLVTAFILSACGSTGSSSSPGASGGPGASGTAGASGTTVPTGSLTIAVPQDFLYLDPNVAKYSSDAMFHAQVFDALVALDADMRAKPSVAESITSIDPNTWQFKLRPGIKFTDGEPLDAAAVKYTVDRVKRQINPDYPQPHPDYANIDHADVVDALTVNIVTKTPDPLLLGRLVRMYIVPPQYVQQVGDDKFGQEPVGSGPYKFVKRIKDQEVDLTANLDYWQGPPAIKDVTLKIIPDSTTALEALKTGEVDIVSGLSPDDFTALGSDSCCRAVSTTGVRSPFIWIYPDSPQGGGDPLADVRVRQALNYAVNKADIVKYILGGQAVQTTTVPSPTSFGYDPSLNPYPYDPAKAKQLLADAGYANGFTVNFEAPNVSGIIAVKPVDVAQAIVSDLAKVGITANLKTMEFGTYVDEKNAKKVPPLFLWSWAAADYVDVDPYLRGTLYSQSRYSLTNDPHLDQLLDAGVASVDPQQRLAPLAAEQEYVYQQAFFIFLYTQNDLYGVSKKVATFPVNGDEIVHVYGIKLAS